MLSVMPLNCSEMVTYATQLIKHHSLNSAITPLPKYVQVRSCLNFNLFLTLFILYLHLYTFCTLSAGSSGAVI